MYCWSSDEERFYGSYPTREEALDEGRGCRDSDTTIYTAKMTNPRIFMTEEDIASRILDDIDDRLYDLVGDLSENFEMSRENQYALGKLVLDFIEANGGFGCYGVDDIETHPGEEEEGVSR